MTAKKPGFSEVSRLQERALHDQLLIARELISHPAEKGRSLEGVVQAVLREMLPSEYGVGTGFVAYHGPNGPELSAQLDIIIYDAIRNGPLSRLAACEVYPIEAVYGYVEVKASLSLPSHDIKTLPNNSMQLCMKKNNVIRDMKTRTFWKPDYVGSPIKADLISINNWLSLRAFVFAFEAEGLAANDPVQLAQGMSDCAKQYNAHLHGVLVLDNAYLTTIPVDVTVADPEDYYHVSYTTTDALTAFKLHLLKALGTFQRPQSGWVPAWETYFELTTRWDRIEPTKRPDG